MREVIRVLRGLRSERDRRKTIERGGVWGFGGCLCCIIVWVMTLMYVIQLGVGEGK